MEVEVEGEIIRIRMNRLNSVTLQKFIKDYNEIYKRFKKERTKKLYFIEEKGFKVDENKTILSLVLILYKTFKKYHDTYVHNIEFLFSTKIYYKLFKSVSILYPLKHPYILTLKQNNEEGEFLGK